MGFFAGLSLVALTLCPLVMFHTTSQQRQPDDKTLLFRLTGLVIVAVIIEIAKGFLAANIAALVFGSGSESSSDAAASGLVYALSCVFDVFVIGYFVGASGPRNSLSMEVDADEENCDAKSSSCCCPTANGLCPTGLSCLPQTAFGAAFWLIHFAGNMIPYIRTQPSGNYNYLAAALCCSLQYIFIAILVAIAYNKLASGNPTATMMDTIIASVPVAVLVGGVVVGASLVPAAALPISAPFVLVFAAIGASMVYLVVVPNPVQKAMQQSNSKQVEQKRDAGKKKASTPAAAAAIAAAAVDDSDDEDIDLETLDIRNPKKASAASNNKKKSGADKKKK